MPISYLFYFIWQQNKDHVSNKNPVLSLTHFIKYYMLFLSSGSIVMSRHDFQTPFVAIFLPISIFMIPYNHKITFDIGLEDLRKIKVSYQFIIYINELIKLPFFMLLKKTNKPQGNLKLKYVSGEDSKSNEWVRLSSREAGPG